jgi:hypothetical protein
VGDSRKAIDCGAGPAQETLLEPSFLTATDAGGSLWEGSPPSLLVVHRERLSSSLLQLSRVACTGPPLWTVALRAERIHAALVAGAQLILVLHGKSGNDDVAGFDVADGRPSFRHGL